MPIRDLSLVPSPSLSKLGEDFVLCDRGSVVFHWADFCETCDLVKSQLSRDASLAADLKRREQTLASLALIPIWVRTENQVRQTTVHDLYEKYLLNQIQLLGLDPFYPSDISFISPTGPFKPLSITDCFNPTTYRDFVIVYLLQGKLPRRDFRIRLKSKILMEYGAELGGAEIVAIEQLTATGLLISLDADVFTRKVVGGETVRFLVNATTLAPALEMSLEEMKPHLSQYAHNFLYSSVKADAIECDLKHLSIQSAFDFSKNRKVFLFVSYDNLRCSNPKNLALLRGFVGHARDLVRLHYGAFQERKSA